MHWNLLPADMLSIKPLFCHFTERCLETTTPKTQYETLAGLWRETAETIRSVFLHIFGLRCATNRMLLDQPRFLIHWLH